MMKNKYNAKKVAAMNRTYDSGLEAKKARDLQFQKMAGEILDWKPQHRWLLYVNGKKIRQYTIDFRVENIDGSVDYIEMKGAKDYAFTVSWNLVQTLFDELTVGENARLYLNNKLVKNSFKNGSNDNNG